MTAAAPKNASTVADLLGIVDGGREPHTACYRPHFTGASGGFDHEQLP